MDHVLGHTTYTAFVVVVEFIGIHRISLEFLRDSKEITTSFLRNPENFLGIHRNSNEFLGIPLEIIEILRYF